MRKNILKEKVFMERKLNKKVREQKAITLIALVITIIVLLILAGVTISMLTGENGILTKASNAKEQMKIGEAKEEIKLAITEEQIRANTGENLGNVFKYGNVWNDLRKKDEKLEVTENTTDSSHTILYKGYYFKIDKDKNVIYIGEAGPEPEETEYTIVYNKNDGSEEKLEQIVEKGTETTLDTSKFTRDGYKIEGWYTNAECTGEKITKTDSNIEVYAKWVELTTIESKGSTTIGDITYTDSYEIWNKAQLEDFRNKVNNESNFENCILKQKADINLNSENWTPIGNKNTTKPFSGTYDAENKKIQNIAINVSTNYQGLFGYVKSGTVKNITVEGSIKGGTGSAGIVACVEDGIIDNCVNGANITHANNNYIYWGYFKENYTFIGGVVGLVEGTTQITNSSNKGDVTIYATGANAIVGGGIVGFVDDKEKGTTIQKCSNSGNVKISKIDKNTNSGLLGGIAGALWGGNVIQCYNTGSISSAETSYITERNEAGGIVGYAGKYSNSSNKTIEQCWNSGYIESSLSGGIIGSNYSGYTVKNCYNSGKVMCNYKCGVRTDLSPSGGGICGWNKSDGTVEYCYNKGEVENNGCNYSESNIQIGSIGGIVGFNEVSSIIKNSYNIGNIKAYPSTTDKRGSVAGGVVGTNCYKMQNVYNSGELIVNTNTITYIGGIAGWNREMAEEVENVYNIGNISTNASYKGGIAGAWSDGGPAWTNYYWLENKGATCTNGNYSYTYGISTSTQIKSLVSNGSFPSTDWSTDTNGYPYLKAFDDANIWVRDANVNGGDPYLKYNPVQ